MGKLVCTCMSNLQIVVSMTLWLPMKDSDGMVIKMCLFFLQRESVAL